jgi:hypothetical protein
MTHGKAVYTIESLNPRTGQSLSPAPISIPERFPGAFGQYYPGMFIVVGASRGLLYIQTDQQLGYCCLIPNYPVAAYRLSDGSLAWDDSKPLSSPPSNDIDQYSQVVLAP